MEVTVQSRQFDVCAAQVQFAGDDLEPLESGRADARGERFLAEQGGVGTGAGDFLETQPAGGIGLRVQVQQEHPSAQGGQTGGEVDGGGRFADAAFLVGNCEDPGGHAGI